jgi:hypothetical protein
MQLPQGLKRSSVVCCAGGGVIISPTLDLQYLNSPQDLTRQQHVLFVGLHGGHIQVGGN